VVQSGNILTVQTDHLDTPRQLTDNTKKVVWNWAYSAFGENQPTNINNTVFNLRYPGQYYDAESKLHYNINRYYDPATGRYTQSDPIGLSGGINTYTYVGGNSIRWSDPEGLWVNIAVGAVVGGGLNLGYQLWNNSGNFKCVDGWEVAKSAVGGAAIGALIPEGLITYGGMQTVTHWGPAGKWVMTGGASWRNYIMAGIPELGYSMSSAVTTQIPKSALSFPSGWEAVKGLIGQRVIKTGTAIGGTIGTANAADNSSNKK
jgi:RHS repeat-associated protein